MRGGAARAGASRNVLGALGSGDHHLPVHRPGLPHPFLCGWHRVEAAYAHVRCYDGIPPASKAHLSRCAAGGRSFRAGGGAWQCRKRTGHQVCVCHQPASLCRCQRLAQAVFNVPSLSSVAEQRPSSMPSRPPAWCWRRTSSAQRRTCQRTQSKSTQRKPCGASGATMKTSCGFRRSTTPRCVTAVRYSRAFEVRCLRAKWTPPCQVDAPSRQVDAPSVAIYGRGACRGEGTATNSLARAIVCAGG